jgi:hypothetical protein
MPLVVDGRRRRCRDSMPDGRRVIGACALIDIQRQLGHSNQRERLSR